MTINFRAATLATMLLLSTLLTACASFVGPRDVKVPLYKLQAGLDRRFPLNNRALELFDVQLSRPQLALLPDSDRIGLALDASVSPPFIHQTWSGSLALSGRLAIDMDRGAIVMTDTRVERFVIDGVDENRQRQLARIANLLVDKAVRDTPVYNFHLEDLRYAGVQFVPTRIRTTADALVITLEPQH